MATVLHNDDSVRKFPKKKHDLDLFRHICHSLWTYSFFHL